MESRGEEPSAPAGHRRTSHCARRSDDTDAPAQSPTKFEASIDFGIGGHFSIRGPSLKPAVSLLAAPSSVVNLACSGRHQSNGGFLSAGSTTMQGIVSLILK